MQDVRGHESFLDQGESELFCLQVYLTGIKTCLFLHETCALPSVLLCLLDFEPLVFEGLQQEKGGPSQCTRSNSNGDGQGGVPPICFPCNKGKSCFFEADPARLSQDLRLPGTLKLMVASKLSERQAAIHGCCPVDLSTFGPNPELSRSLPRVVSSWGHHTQRVESKDPRGTTLATAELTVSLSYLGAARALFQVNAPAATATASPQPPGGLGSAAAVPPCCTPAGGGPSNPQPAQSLESGRSADVEEEQAERQSAGARKRGNREVAGDRIKGTPPPLRGGGCGGWFGKQKPGGDAWTSEFNPHDGSLAEVATSKLSEAADSGLDAALDSSENAVGNPANDCEDAGAAASSSGGPSPKREQAHGRTPEDSKTPVASTNEKLHSPSAAGSAVSAAPASATAVTAATAPAALVTVHVEPATSAPPTSISAAEPGRVPLLPASKEEERDVGGDTNKAVVETREAAAVTLETASGITTQEPPQDTVVLERKAAGRVLPGNNHLINAWRPSETPSEPGGGIEFNGWSATTGVSRAVAPAGGGWSKGQGSVIPKISTIQTKKRTPPATARGKEAVSARKRRPLGSSGSKPKQAFSLAASTTTNTPPPPTTKATQREREKAARRPWGAGPGLTAAPTPRGAASRPRSKNSREGRTGGKEYDGRRHSDRVSSCPRATSRARPSPPHSGPWKENSPPLLGPTVLEQFLPTWTSLVAEAAWLRSADAASMNGNGMLGGGGEDSGGDGRGGCGGECGGERYAGVSDGASARPAKGRARLHDEASASGACRSGLTGHRRQTGLPGGPAFERGEFYQWAVRGERSFNRESGGSRQGCGVPAPSLDPTVERVLMDWIRSRVDRNGRLIPPGPSDSSKAATDGGEESRWREEEHRHNGPQPPLAQRNHGDRLRHHLQREQQERLSQRRDGRSSVDEQLLARHEQRAATTTRLYKMFEQALEDLLLQKRKEKVVAATGSTSRTVDGGDGDGVPPCDGVGWVGVVRRVSEIAGGERADELTTIPTAGQPPRQKPIREVEVKTAGGRGGGRGSDDEGRTAHTGPTDGTPPGDCGGDGEPPRQTRGNNVIYPAADSSRSAGGPALLRSPPIRAEPCGGHRPLSPPPRLPPLAETPRSPPLTSLLPPLASPKGLTASPKRRPPAAAPAASGTTGSRSLQSPGSPRARRWLLDGRPRGGQGSTIISDGSAGLGGSEDGGGATGRGVIIGAAETENTAARPVPPSVCSASPAYHGGGSREEAEEVWEDPPWATGAGDGAVSPLRTAAACRGMQKAAVRADGSTGGEGEEVLALEEYESDFEDEEDEE